MICNTGRSAGAAVALLPIADERQGELTPSEFNGYARNIRKKASLLVAPLQNYCLRL